MPRDPRGSLPAVSGLTLDKAENTAISMRRSGKGGLPKSRRSSGSDPDAACSAKQRPLSAARVSICRFTTFWRGWRRQRRSVHGAALATAAEAPPAAHRCTCRAPVRLAPRPPATFLGRPGGPLLFYPPRRCACAHRPARARRACSVCAVCCVCSASRQPRVCLQTAAAAGGGAGAKRCCAAAGKRTSMRLSVYLRPSNFFRSAPFLKSICTGEYGWLSFVKHEFFADLDRSLGPVSGG